MFTMRVMDTIRANKEVVVRVYQLSHRLTSTLIVYRTFAARSNDIKQITKLGLHK